MGASAVRRINDSTVITQADQDAAAASLKSQLCTGDDKATCDATIDAVVAEALPLTYEAPQADGTTAATSTPASAVVGAAAQGGYGSETWTYSIVGGRSSTRKTVDYKNDQIDRYCSADKVDYTVGVMAQYGDNVAIAPVYRYVAKTPYTCLTADQYMALQLQQMLGGVQ